MALAEAMTTVKVNVMVLLSVEIEVELPFSVNVDNIRAIFLANNHTGSNHMKPVDICYHLIPQYNGENQIHKIGRK